MDAPSLSPFGPVHVIEPAIKHTHTAIFLHGRGSTGKEFAEDLTESLMSDKRTLMQALPSWRWVFPSSRRLWSTTFREEMPAWFEADSLTSIATGQDLQMQGIQESVKYLDGIWKAELDRLDGSAANIVLGGISQGGAIGIWTIFCANSKEPAIRPAAFVGISTWLPFAVNINKVFRGDDEVQDIDGDRFVETMMPRPPGQRYHSIAGFPVFLGHGTDDAYVDVRLGQQARQVLSQAGLVVEWREYSGADQEGHWLQTPDEIHDIFRFLESIPDK